MQGQDWEGTFVERLPEGSKEASMQHRFAYAILVRLNSTTTPSGREVDAWYGTVQAVDAPEATHFTSLRQLSQWFENVLSPHLLPQAISNFSEPPK